MRAPTSRIVSWPLHIPLSTSEQNQLTHIANKNISYHCVNGNISNFYDGPRFNTCLDINEPTVALYGRTIQNCSSDPAKSSLSIQTKCMTKYAILLVPFYPVSSLPGFLVLAGKQSFTITYDWPTFRFCLTGLFFCRLGQVPKLFVCLFAWRLTALSAQIGYIVS